MQHWKRRLVPVMLAVVAAATTIAASTPRVTFTDTTLKNGLRVILAEDHAAPVFSVAVNYNVGSRDERKGHTGFAHLFEHMMFKGSEQVGPGEHFTLIFNNGGSMNGTTNEDRTLYYDTLPANQLDLALFLEADRMWSLDINKDNLDNQRNAVQEERRLGVDNVAYGKTDEALNGLAYKNFAYAHSVIGSMADLNAADVSDVKAFFKMYYAPNNAVLSVVGDFKTAECLEKIRTYFEKIPSQPAPPVVDVTEPAQTEERRLTLDDALAKTPRLDIVWHVPAGNTPEDDALNILSSILSGGRSSRLYESLVRDRQLTPNVFAGPSSNRGPSLFQIEATVLIGKSVADLETAIYTELDKVKNGPIEGWEIEKARNSQKRAYVSGLGSSLQRAVLLGQYALFYNDPNLINTRADRLSTVTTADVQRVARQYLTKENRSVIITNPKPAASGEGGR